MRLNGEGAKRIHWMKNHRNMKWNGNVLKRYRDERCGTKVREISKYGRYKNELQNEVDELPTLIREKYMVSNSFLFFLKFIYLSAMNVLIRRMFDRNWIDIIRNMLSERTSM